MDTFHKKPVNKIIINNITFYALNNVTVYKLEKLTRDFEFFKTNLHYYKFN